MLVTHNVMGVMTQKRICASLNVWMRGPFLVITTFIIWVGHRSSQIEGH
jgi:hypothetical protein